MEFLIIPVVGIVLVLIIVLSFAPVMVWADRRQSAMIQDRIGPVRAGIPIMGKNITLFGLLHPLADAIKFMWKEDFIPPKGDKVLHALAPVISLIPAIAAFAVIPFSAPVFLDYLVTLEGGFSLPDLPIDPQSVGREVQVASLNVGILFIFAVAGTGVVGAAIAGYCSDNKFALLGGLRAAGQMVSYEVSLGLSLVGCFMLYGTLLLEDMVRWQVEGHTWGIFYQPLAFILFFTGSIAETKRIPFDVPEGESELAAGYFTEYSGMKFGMFMMGEYIEIVVGCCLLTVLFFGGYDVPFFYPEGIAVGAEVHNVHFDLWLPYLGQVLDTDAGFAVPHVVVVLLTVVNFIGKVIALCWLNLMIRWSLPRFRYDQIMKLCWRYMLPLALINVFLTGSAILFMEG